MDPTRAAMDFEWLADLQKSQCFTTCEISNPAKSSDFGADGYTASLSDWHELLQLTAPDATCGLVFVRGLFPNTPAAFLARAQRHDESGSKGAFGSRIQPARTNTDLEVGERRAQGWVNFRWPYTQYELKQKDDRWNLNGGTYEQISFVRSGTVFQIIRLKSGNGSSLSDYDADKIQAQQTVQVKVGGAIRFGCPCSNRGPPDEDTFKLSASENGTRLSCVSSKYQKRLQVQLFINGTAQNIWTPTQNVHEDEVNGTEVDISSFKSIELSDGDPTFIVAAYTLRNMDERAIGFDGASLANLEDYLGISNDSVNMTDRLWTALCSTNYEASEAVECCVVGRCVEQILCVTSIPLPFLTRRGVTSDNSQNISPANQIEDESQRDERKSEIALVCNIVTPQYVDLQSAFFQIRLLVKVYDFIKTRHFEPDLLERFQSLDNMRESYLARLRQFMCSCLIWLINTDMKPGNLILALPSNEVPPDLESHPSARLEKCEQNRVGMNDDRTYNQTCYATLAVWYVMKHCPQAVTDDFKSNILLPKLARAYDSVQKRASRDKEPTPKNDVLQWLHLSSLLLICGESIGNDRVIDLFTASGLDRQELIRTQQRFEKYVSRLKTSQIEAYSVEHEELDRVLLLGEELGLDALRTPFTSSLVSSRAAQTRKRIAERRRTTTFNPGPKLWKGSKITSNGPWELLCTNHQSYLRVADETNIRAGRDRLFEFMMADYSFMSSWDRSDSNIVGRWWDLEPASVLCGTLLDLKVEGKLRSAPSETALQRMEQSIHETQIAPAAQEDNFVLTEDQSHDASVREILLQMKQIQEESSRDHLIQMRQLLVQEEIGASFATRAFDWMTCKPARLFHPEWWIQSLQDTPEMYQANKQRKDVPLRKDLRRYLAGRKRLDVIRETEYTASTIEKKLPPEDLQFLSVFDLSLTSLFTFDLAYVSIASVTVTRPFTSKFEINSGRERGRSMGAVSPRPKFKQASASYSSSQLEFYRKSLFERLNDSLVDIGAKHRILFAEKCSPSLVGSFLYLYHPDALDTFDSYFGATSRFAENREALMWTTTITISHWSISPTSQSKQHVELFNENRNNGDFPPASIASLGRSKKHKEPFQPTDIVEERSSSLVITGDPSGHLWICSIWSSLTDSDELSISIQSLPSILQQFIHQQSCARCLVFLILLGHLCEKLAGEYEMILAKLDIIVGLGEKVLLEGLEWGTSEAVDKLKKMLWGLEALRVFDDRLSASLAQIQKAQEAMERTVKQEAGQQHIDLLQEYNNVIEEFEKRYGMLSDVQIRTQLKIRQVTGLRDGISTVTNVEDSQTALRDSQTTIRQGNNIRILTYITIAYLPLGFVTGLFSINHADFMNGVGNAGFAILVVVFVLSTYALALSLENIIDSWTKLAEKKWSKIEPKKWKSRRKDEEVDDSEKDVFEGLGGLKWRGRGEQGDDRISKAA